MILRLIMPSWLASQVRRRKTRLCSDCPALELIRPQSVRSQPTQRRSRNPLMRAIQDARRILGEYIEPGSRDAMQTVERLLAVLDKNDVVHALDRMHRRRVIRLVE
jgi:hypothetical protein